MSDLSPAATRSDRGGSRRRRRTLAVVALVVGGAALLAPKPAGAGSYLVRQCAPETPSAQASWTRTSDNYRQRGRCASGGGLQIYNRGDRTAKGRYGAWTWRAPAGTVFASLRVSASLTRHAGHRGELWGAPEAGPAFRFGREHRAFRVHTRRRDLSSFEARLRCVRASGCGRSDSDRAHAYVKGLRLRIRDRTAPRIGSVAGELLRGRVVRGARGLTFDARDRGGGVRRLYVQANGAQVGSAATPDCGLGDGFSTRLVPCPRSTTETRAVPTTHRAFVTGPNAVRVCADDLASAGRANRGCERHRVWVDNACPTSAEEGARLTAGFMDGRPRVTVRSDRRAVVSGRLTDDAGRPAADAKVCALTRVRRNGAKVRVAAVRRTDADGRYAIPLRPGPNRRVFLHHARRDAVVSRHGLVLLSRARPTLKVRSPRRPRRGDSLRFVGRLPAPLCAGRVVEIQARLPSGGWQVFRTARTNRRCRFATAYRLRATTSPTRYRFRARVRRQPGYPYLSGRSPVRTTWVAG